MAISAETKQALDTKRPELLQAIDMGDPAGELDRLLEELYRKRSPDHLHFFDFRAVLAAPTRRLASSVLTANPASPCAIPLATDSIKRRV